MWKEFKEFALKGNLIETAIAFVMGAAFGKVVTAFVEKMFAPLVGLLMGGVNLNDYKFVIYAATDSRPEVALAWGEFVTASIDFIVVAVVMFFIVKTINTAKKKEVVSVSGAPTELQLLGEIRDLLKK
ncbi:large conductance mechanosensitive channel protein MscL [Haliscomenobacter sp.]|jgi:large conductance mechanosensitive channel|uniref:large conductance mechanosensitive channel protein MscL n=1 Tax=Haliscomenobacter sp. TaxID=2717303 RepID=UPI003BA9A7C1